MSATVNIDGPTLAMRAGIYREQPATGQLAQLFCRVWSHKLPADFRGRALVVPDGCSDLIWIEGRLMVIGPDRIAAFPALAAGETILGLRFRPGAAMRWLDVPLTELVGQAVPLQELRNVRVIEEQLAGEADMERRLACFQAWARREAAATTGPQDEMEALFKGLMNSGTLHDVSADATLGERTLRRRSRDHFGYGPKTLERILRLQRFLRLVRRPVACSLAVLAYEAGYADQAHMTRDVKELTTLTPQDIRRQIFA